MTTALMLPWLQITEPMTIAKDLVLRPFDDASEQLPQSEVSALNAATAGFYNSFSVSNLLADLRDIAAESTTLTDEELGGRLRGVYLPTPLKPSIILTADNASAVRRAHTAVKALAFGSVVENQRFSRVNGSVFHALSARLSVGGAFADITHRMHGRDLNFSFPSHTVHLRPRHVPEDNHIHANLEFVRSMAAGCRRRRGGKKLARSLDALQIATSESPDMSQTLQESLFALGVELIADIPTRHKKGTNAEAAINQRLHQLLDPLFARQAKTSSRRKRGRRAPMLMRAFWAVRRRRNSFWHPKPSRRLGYRFSRQLLVHPLLIALNMTYAMMIARLVELDVLPIASDFVTDVYAITDWIAQLGPELENGLTHPDDAPDAQSRAMAMVAWNDASERASSPGMLRSHERFVARISEEMGGR